MRPRSIFPNKSGFSVPTVSRMRALSIVLTWSQRARESLGRPVSFAESNGWTKRSAALPLIDESGTTVTVEEMSFASVLETTMHGRVLGTSAPRAGSRPTQTNEPLTKKASPLYPDGQILALFDLTPSVRSDTPPAVELSVLSGYAGLSSPPDNCSINRSRSSCLKVFLPS